MQDMLLVSVIIPVYKVEKYIDKCIKSVAEQTYNNLEIILVDDGSPDSCGEICERYAKSDSRIRVIHQQNGGLSKARNTGLDAANGDCIFFVDSDDYIAQDTISTMAEKMQLDNADIVCCNLMRVDENGQPLESPEGFENAVLTKEQFTLKCYDDRYYVPSHVVWSKLYKREVIGGHRFPEGKLHEDEFFTYRIIDNAKTISTLSNRFYAYVIRSGSIMTSGVSIRSLDVVEAYLQKAAWFCQKGNHYLMYRALRQACGTMARKRQKLDMKDKNTRKRYYELKRDFFRLLITKGIGRVPVQCFAGGFLFMISEKLLLRITGD